MRLLLLTGLLLLQSDPSPSDLRERVRVDYVLLDVLAFDRQGRAVGDLTVEDFDVFEAKRRMTIDSFERTDLFARPLEAARSESERLGPGGRSRVIAAVDFAASDASTRRRALKWLMTFVEQAPEDAQLAYTVVSLDGGTLVEDFTGPREELEGILRAYVEDEAPDRGGVRGSSRAAWGRAGYARSLFELEERFDNCRDGLMAGAMDHVGFFGCVQGELDLYVGYLQDRTRYVIEELEGLIARFPPGPRPTTLLFASPGFSLSPGQGAIELAEIYLRLNRRPGPGTRPGAPPSTGFPALSPARGLEEEFRAVYDAAVRRRVIIHTFDPVHYDPTGQRRASPAFTHGRNDVVTAYGSHGRELERGLEHLADGTGGLFMAGPDPDALWETLERSRVIYTLGYATRSGDPERFRRIRVKCKRRGVRLIHRRGYFPDAGGG